MTQEPTDRTHTEEIEMTTMTEGTKAVDIINEIIEATRTIKILDRRLDRCRPDDREQVGRALTQAIKDREYWILRGLQDGIAEDKLSEIVNR